MAGNKRLLKSDTLTKRALSARIFAKLVLISALMLLIGCSTAARHKSLVQDPRRGADPETAQSRPYEGDYGQDPSMAVQDPPYPATEPYYEREPAGQGQYPAPRDQLPEAQPAYPTSGADVYGRTNRVNPYYNNSRPGAYGPPAEPVQSGPDVSDEFSPPPRRIIWKGDKGEGRAWEDAPPEQSAEGGLEPEATHGADQVQP
jgi:hypothetical protein